MNKKGKISSGGEHIKNFKKTTTSINNKKDTQSNRKATYTKSVEKKKPYGVMMEPRVLNSNEGKAERDKKVTLAKPRKDNSMSNRNVKTNKGKEYQNNLNKLTEDNEVEKEKEYDFFNFKLADEYKKKLDNRAKPNNEDKFSKSTNVKQSKLTSYKDQKSDQDIKKNKKMQKNKTANIVDDSDEEEESEKDDILHRLFYKPVIDNKRPDADKNKAQKKKEEKEKQKEKERQKEREKAKNKENQKKLLSYQQSNDKMAVSMERTDDMIYNVDDKKIYSNKKNKNDSNSAKDSNTKGSSKKVANLGMERTVDLFVIDGDDDIEITSRYKKKIDRKRNRYKEICIERSNVSKPDKITGFILIRKSKGKKIYELLLEDNIDKSNGILKNNEIKMKGEVIQLISLDQLVRLRNELDYNKKIVNELQNELRAKEYSKEMDKNKDKDKVREKDKQISTLKSKNDELNNLVRKQDQQITYLEKEMKQLQLSYDLLKESYKDLEKENKSLMAQNQPSKVTKNVFPRKLDSKEIKGRQKNYNNELKKVPTRTEDDEEKEKNINKTEEKKPAEEEHDYNADFVVGGRDLKSQKMKNAVNRFTKKYRDVIKEEKKAKEEREREEKERLENEERELEDDEYWENNAQQKQEMERIERENRERERIEKEERERREIEERERREIERKLIEERVRKEREDRERERKEKEERDRQDRERRERDRKERERKEKEKREKEKKEKHVKIGMAPARPNKMMGGNFAKMLADKIKMAPPGMRKGGVGGMQTTSKPPVQDNVDMVTLLEEAPFEERTRKRKPSRKVFIEKIVDNEEDSD